jgi:hypothetical protein
MSFDPVGPISGPNPLCPEQMSPEARIEEIGRILAGGLVRVLEEKSSSLSAETGDRFVDLPPLKSGGRRRKRIRIGGIDEASQ